MQHLFQILHLLDYFIKNSPSEEWQYVRHEPLLNYLCNVNCLEKYYYHGMMTSEVSSR